jgi:PAS domain S-box-containing protein
VADDKEAIEKLGPVFLDSYFVVDRDRRIESFNQAFVQMVGLKPSERRKLTGSHCYETLRLEICKDRCIALECIKKEGHVRMEEIRGVDPSGRELVLELSAVPLRNDRGEITGAFVTHRDVTDERRLKQKFLEEQAQHRAERQSLLKVLEDRAKEPEPDPRPRKRHSP